VSQLFEDGGTLDVTHFSPDAAGAIEDAEELAVQAQHEIIGRIHLLYGLLRDRSSALSDAVRKQRHDPAILAELLFAELPRGNATTGPPRPLRFTGLSTNLVEILCFAEKLADPEQTGRAIDTDALSRAWVRSGGGAGGSFLVRNGLRITEFFA
jgi:ATP-dependent Clp protease ATP-binding subunit ClpA